MDAGELQALTDKVLAENADVDETTFLGALFDAGLAWVHWAVGEGGLGLEPGMQDVVDTVLHASGRRPDWMRNPMGIGMVGPAIAQCGREDQRQRHMRPIFTAEEIWCQLFSEPGAGSDVATLATRAVQHGDEWIVNGQKVWTSSAHLARYGLLLARTDPDAPKHKGITAFIVDMHAPGVEVRPLRSMSGTSDFNEVYFTDTRIPDSQRVGGVDQGWSVAVATLANERVSIGGTVDPTGAGEIRVAVAVYRETPRNQLQRQRLIELWVEAEVLRLGKLRAQSLREQGTPGPEGSILKLADTRLAQRIRELTVDLRGAAGMLVPGYETGSDDDPALSFVASPGLTIAGGTPDIQRNIIGERILGLPPEPRSDRDMPWHQIPRHRSTIQEGSLGSA
jgi:alkylation response protein AidB-like acyl-CoA dehydrogenase